MHSKKKKNCPAFVSEGSPDGAHTFRSFCDFLGLEAETICLKKACRLAEKLEQLLWWGGACLQPMLDTCVISLVTWAEVCLPPTDERRKWKRRNFSTSG